MTSNASFRRRLIAGLVLALAGAAGAQPPHEVSAPLPLRLVIAPLAAPPQCGISQADLDEPMRALARRWPMQSIPAATSVAEPAALHLSVWLNPAKGGGCHYDIVVGFEASPGPTADTAPAAAALRRAAVGTLPRSAAPERLRDKLDAVGSRLIADWRASRRLPS